MLIIYSFIALLYAVLQGDAIASLDGGALIETVKIAAETVLSIELLVALIGVELVKSVMHLSPVGLIRCGVSFIVKIVVTIAILKVSFVNLPSDYQVNKDLTLKIPMTEQTTTSIFTKKFKTLI